MIRTRIAPSPTGYPHIGTIYQALFNYAFAKKRGGEFIVRIEDTDRTRFVEGAERGIFSALDWFDLTEDESARRGGEFGPYRQSERLAIYHKHAQQLLDAGHAYFAYYPKASSGQKKDYHTKSSPQENLTTSEKPPKTIKEMIDRGEWILRMKVPNGETVTVHDEIRGDITFSSDQVTEQVLLKSDGFPTYHLAAVVDDHLMEISHIVRAEEWLSSLPKHVLLYRYFDWEMPPVYHTVTLRNPDKSKLSKRHGHTNVLWFKDEGYLPEAILNYLALLGWSHPEEKEIFSLSEFIELFDLKDISPISPIFDLTKLTWMNQQYLQSLSDREFKKRLIAFASIAESLDQEGILDQLIPLLKTRMNTLKDFVTLIEIDSVTLTDKEKEIAQAVVKRFEELETWEKIAIFEQLKPLLQEYKVRMPVFYKIFTGKEKGLPLPDMLEILGKERALTRLQEVLRS